MSQGKDEAGARSRGAPLAARSRFLSALAAACRAPTAPPPDAHLLVAVSGGPDSTALVVGLAALAPPQRWRLTTIHVAHGLRGSASEAERTAVAHLAESLGLAHVERQVSVSPGSNLEARARQARHTALREVARSTGAARIVLAHTADDQAETVLLRLLRGSGRGGLGGMQPLQGILWRPLLDVRRSDVLRFLADTGHAAAVDHSNADLRHARNRVRRLLVPLLEAEWNPGIVPALGHLATRLRDEDRVLEALAQRRYRRLLVGSALDATRLAALPPGLARRVIRSWLSAETRRTPSAIHVERALALAAGRARGDVTVPGPTRVLRVGRYLVRRPGARGEQCPFTVPLAPGAVVVHPRAAWRLRLGPPRPREAGDPAVRDARSAVFDAGALRSPLRLRSPRPGDRIALPRVGTRKVQDVLVDAHVPREDRLAVPVLEAAGTIVWIAGVARSRVALVVDDTRTVLDAVLEVLPSRDVAPLEPAW